MTSLTKKQARVLAFVRRCVATTGRPPTLTEIADHIGIRNHNGARSHLLALEKKGRIERLPNARGIRVLKGDK